AVARRVAQGFRRDERTLGLMFVAPLVITGLLGWVMRDQTDTIVDVVVVNEAGPVGDRIVSALQNAASDPDKHLAIAGVVADRAAAEAKIRDGSGDLAILIPSDLLAAVASGQRPTLTVISAGIEPGAEAGNFGTLQSVMAGLANELVPPGGTPPILPNIQHETVFLSPDADQVDVFAPIFLGFFGYFFVYILTGISFLRERVGGTLERLLSTPVTRGEIVIGYSLGFGLFAAIQVLLLSAFILNSFTTPALGPVPAFTIGLGVSSAGPTWIAIVMALLLSVGAVNLGIFLSTFARTELQIMQFIPLVIVPQGLLSGLLWPVERLPDVLQVIAHLLPLTYAVEGLRAVMLKGADLSSSVVQVDLAVLAAVALVFVLLASLTIKREVV
ncbi:MAG TPA: ABC transporter permease, partial [Candidatus Limnocylindrales bacterium]|nr:ABC transporter permease [Candidatus Limnocylindrales bacterium]